MLSSVLSEDALYLALASMRQKKKQIRYEPCIDYCPNDYRDKEEKNASYCEILDSDVIYQAP